MKLVARIVANHVMDAEEIEMFQTFNDEEKSEVLLRLAGELSDLISDFTTEQDDAIKVVVTVEDDEAKLA
jgi:phenylpyruvate tautomerase PptA (4-oxalocrotonate tautomerase family)